MAMPLHNTGQPGDVSLLLDPGDGQLVHPILLDVGPGVRNLLLDGNSGGSCRHGSGGRDTKVPLKENGFCLIQDFQGFFPPHYLNILES